MLVAFLASLSACGGHVESAETDRAANGVWLVPVAYDRDQWTNFFRTGLGPDGIRTTAADGTPALSLFSGPYGIYLSLDDEHVGTQQIDDWIDLGPTVADIEALRDRGLLPPPTSTWSWIGVNGYRADAVQALNGHAGATVIMALFVPYQTGDDYQAGLGQGSKVGFKVSSFVGVRIVDPATADPPGNPSHDVLVQPAAIVDPGSAFGGPTPAVGAL
jgi:hypothetical protein